MTHSHNAQVFPCAFWEGQLLIPRCCHVHFSQKDEPTNHLDLDAVPGAQGGLVLGLLAVVCCAFGLR